MIQDEQLAHAVAARLNCHPDCPWCARSAWRWVKERLQRMARRAPGVSLSYPGMSVWMGEPASFAEAASTSIKPEC